MDLNLLLVIAGGVFVGLGCIVMVLALLGLIWLLVDWLIVRWAQSRSLMKAVNYALEQEMWAKIEGHDWYGEDTNNG